MLRSTEKLCPCPEEEDEYIVDFTELTKKKDEEGLTEPAETQEDLVADILGSEEAEEDPLGLQEEIDLDENLLSSILEELVVDLDPALDGYGNNGVPNSHLQHAQEQLLARAQDTEVKEENEALKKALKKLKVENRSLQSLGQESKKMKDIIYLMRDRLNEASLSNAKLLYTNKVLISDSLNGRQKNKIVEAISGAETVEEAKVIYETLQNAVGSTTIKKEPQSLSEAVKNSSAGLLLHGRSQKATKKDDSSLARWKILAGLT
mgnify:CR=1 FL=1